MIKTPPPTEKPMDARFLTPVGGSSSEAVCVHPRRRRAQDAL